MTTIKTIAAAGALACGLATAAGAAPLPQGFAAMLSGANAGTASPAMGGALFALDGEMGSASLSWTIAVSADIDFTAFGGGGAGGDSATAMHIHGAPPGLNGPVIYDFLADADAIAADGGGTALSGVWSSAEGLDAHYALFRDVTGFTDAYVNLHTQGFAPGAIRGQIESASEVPLPAAAPLAALGLAALGFAARRPRG